MNWIVIDSIIFYWLEQAFKEWNKMLMEFVVCIRFVCTEWDNTNANGNECVNNWTLGYGVQNDKFNTSHKDITILIDRIIYKRLNWILQCKMSLFWVYWNWFNWNESRIWLSYSILFSNPCIHSHFFLACILLFWKY